MSVAEGARVALDNAGIVLLVLGTAVPLCLIAIMAAMTLTVATLSALCVATGLAALLAGSWLKFVIVTRAGFNQGFALPHLPVRGVAR